MPNQRLVRDQEGCRRPAREVQDHNSVGRIGDAEEVASAALFLASKESSFISGIDLPVDGGLVSV
jgi:NAD(P)-dependent dehydrogenase (short-subunit alcohol dehydrogenase family)